MKPAASNPVQPVAINASKPATVSSAAKAIRPSSGLIILAPMEGVLDHTLRHLLTALGGIDRCVTEFVRVTDQLLPARTFLRLCPELQNGGYTSSGVPVHVQLLGGQAEPLAINANRAAALGAPGIDLNFGCPAKTVNRHDGGSVLLREPERVHTLVAAVRTATPAHIPVTAKIRLGFEDHALLEDIAAGIAAAGADELAIHARTRADGYRPPAHWHTVAPLAASLSLPLIINGEIWNEADARQARLESGCRSLMLGRGALARPDLPLRLRVDMARMTAGGCGQAPARARIDWIDIVPLLQALLDATVRHYPIRFAGNPIKQWLGYLRLGYPEAGPLFESIKRLRDPADLAAALRLAARSVPPVPGSVVHGSACTQLAQTDH